MAFYRRVKVAIDSSTKFIAPWGLRRGIEFAVEREQNLQSMAGDDRLDDPVVDKGFLFALHECLRAVDLERQWLVLGGDVADVARGEKCHLQSRLWPKRRGLLA